MGKKFYVSCVGLSLLTFVFLWWPDTNRHLFAFINAVFPNRTRWMMITNSGSFFFISCLLFIVFRSHQRMLTNALLAGIFLHFSVAASKTLFAMPRPEHITDLHGLILLGPALGLDNFSMPSGHTATAFMSVILIAKTYVIIGWRLWAMLGMASLIAISRIALGVHWPADVCAGALLGLLAGTFFSHEKLVIQHNAARHINYFLCLPLIVLSILHVKKIDSFSRVLSDGLIVFIGLIALVLWIFGMWKSIRLSR